MFASVPAPSILSFFARRTSLMSLWSFLRVFGRSRNLVDSLASASTTSDPDSKQPVKSKKLYNSNSKTTSKETALVTNNGRQVFRRMPKGCHPYSKPSKPKKRSKGCSYRLNCKKLTISSALNVHAWTRAIVNPLTFSGARLPKKTSKTSCRLQV